jgi:hypothetical protein
MYDWDDDDDVDVNVYTSVPANCDSVTVGGATYRDCNGVWYKRVYQGNQIAYIVVPDPR